MKTERQFTLYTHSFVTKLLIRANSGNISTHFQFFIVVVPLDSPGSNPGSFRVGLMVDNLAMRFSGRDGGKQEDSYCTKTVLSPHFSREESGSFGDEILPTAYSCLGGEQEEEPAVNRNNHLY
ncbi:uncharacterized protein LOC111864654 isoform X1 [Cryptotermes secundus]|uniref:uncharacterized protein LOC111864654 isoform X1 n=1 Tax=Cryptotermes secundus TaxID=105785 RepID=UPI001454E162|nr:uncharacterized protein LOC111864654 isoform X1 [Cryptotermes secundus]